jgi:hypothetical protein
LSTAQNLMRRGLAELERTVTRVSVERKKIENLSAKVERLTKATRDTDGRNINRRKRRQRRQRAESKMGSLSSAFCICRSSFPLFPFVQNAFVKKVEAES